MITIDLNTIHAVPEKLASFLGADFVGRNLSTYKPEGLSPTEILRMKARAHPLAPIWFQLIQDVQKSIERKMLLLSDQSLFAVKLLSDLQDIRSVSNQDRILDSITSRNKFASGSFEAWVAAHYLQTNKHVEAIAEGDSKSCDLRVVCDDNTSVFIECKSLEDFAIRDARHWESLTWLCAKRLQKSRCCWSIEIEATRDVSGKEFQEVQILLSDAIGSRVPRDFATRSFTVRCKEIAEPDREYEGGIIGNTTSDHGLIQAEIRVVQGKMFYKNPCLISATEFKGRDHTISILNAIDDANSQLPKDGVNVVHIEVPYKQGERLLQVADDAFDTVLRELSTKYQRIKAVAISGTTIGKAFPPLNNPIVPLFAVVPNYSCKQEFPPTFSILGSSPKPPTPQAKYVNPALEQLMPEAVPPDEMGPIGTIYVSFEIFDVLPNQKGRPLFYYCSSDGRQQLKLWQTFNNVFRAEVVNEATGRQFVEADLNDLEIGKLNAVAISWSSDSMGLSCNGEEFAPTRIKFGN